MSRRGSVAIVVALVALAIAVVVRSGADPTPATRAHGPATTAPRYQCAMHPQIVSDHPGTCPICHMELERVGDDGESPPAAAAASDVPGHAGFVLSAARQQLIGVTRGRVERRSLTLDLRVPGTVASDPDLYRAILEYREAERTARILAGHPGKDGPGEDERGAGSALMAATRLKLRRLGLSPAEIQQLARENFKGEHADPTALLLPGEQVWVYARVAASEVGLVQPGQAVTVTTPAAPGITYTATIAGIDPSLDPTTRTARVRIPLATPGGTLRPETFVHVVIHVALGEALAVPVDAVLDTGTHQIVFVVGAGGTFSPRAVRLGRRADGFFAVDDGLRAGEEVVTSANFLIDSESRFRAAVADFEPRGDGP